MRIALLINPVAGLGGPAALKGSDGVEIQIKARARGASERAGQRMGDALTACTEVHSDLDFVTWGGPMGAALLEELGLTHEVLGRPEQPSSAADTIDACRALVAAGAELILFAGGDGTARDLLDGMTETIPVLGVPAGVKMHSGVFAVTPADAGAVVVRLVNGGLVGVRPGEVRDVDETALRSGTVGSRYYGELQVPMLGGYLQHTKVGGREVESLALVEIVEEVCERLDRESAGEPATVVYGPGSSVQAIGARLGYQLSLLGFDVYRAGRCIATDADARVLDRLIDAETILIMSFGRDQGILFGRGNQQLTSAMLRRIPRAQLWVVATRSKLESLGGRPLRMDTGDPECDASWAGLIEIITGFDDVSLHRVEAP
jgi:predicted polyphosphate/ATP-dependent NAD kinase